MASEGKERTPVKAIPSYPARRRLLRLFNPWVTKEPGSPQALAQVKVETHVSRKGPAIAEISKPEGKYVVMYNDHVSPRNPDDLSDDLDALVVEGTAGNKWLDATEKLSGSGMTSEQRQARLKAGLPVEIVSDKDSRDVSTIQLYKSRGEYQDLFPKLESNRTPLFVADMEFRPTWRLADDAFSALDTSISHIVDLVDRQIPGQRSAKEIETFLQKNLEGIRDSTVSTIDNAKVFDGVVYPGIIASLELGVGAAILANIIHEKKKLNRRGFLGKMFTGAKAVGAAWLALPAIELSLFTGTGYQGEHIPPEQRKLVQNTHPETWLFILALRNVVLAQKEHWMMENLGIKNLGTTIGSAHTVLEDEIRKTSDERMALLQRFKPLLLMMFDKESIYRIAKFGFDGKGWGLTDGYEVPELKALVGGDKSDDTTEPKIPKSVEQGQDTLLECQALEDFRNVRKETMDLRSPALSQNLGEQWKNGTVHFTDVIGKEGVKLATMYVVTHNNLQLGSRNMVGQRAYILSRDLKRNLDIAPQEMNPVIQTSLLKDVKHRPPISQGFKPDPREDFRLVHRISFYVNAGIQDEIIKDGCAILVTEVERDNIDNKSNEIYMAIPDAFKKIDDMLRGKSP